MTDSSKAKELLQKYQDGVASEEEKAWIESWYAHMEEHAANPPEAQVNADAVHSHNLLQQQLHIVRIWPRIAVAASLLAVICLSAWVLSRRHTAVAPVMAARQDVAPGTNKAILTLANGNRIQLDDHTKEQLLKQAGVSIIRTDSGQIIYKVDEASNAATDKYNIITTPRGGQYQVILPDGSHVWINAASSLRYPVAFGNKERRVELTGEAYFEIAADAGKPFRLISRNQVTEVLGTSFNVNAYDDEADTKTTLISGAIKVNNIRLQPGQQAISNTSGFKTVNVDIEEEIAWKNGYFVFNDEQLVSIMRKISRWYDVDLHYQDTILKTERFNGTVSRYGNVSQVIRVLELTQAAHFKVTGKQIIIAQ